MKQSRFTKEQINSMFQMLRWNSSQPVGTGGCCSRDWSVNWVEPNMPYEDYSFFDEAQGITVHSRHYYQVKMIHSSFELAVRSMQLNQMMMAFHYLTGIVPDFHTIELEYDNMKNSEHPNQPHLDHYSVAIELAEKSLTGGVRLIDISNCCSLTK